MEQRIKALALSFTDFAGARISISWDKNILHTFQKLAHPNRNEKGKSCWRSLDLMEFLFLRFQSILLSTHLGARAI